MLHSESLEASSLPDSAWTEREFDERHKSLRVRWLTGNENVFFLMMNYHPPIFPTPWAWVGSIHTFGPWHSTNGKQFSPSDAIWVTPGLGSGIPGLTTGLADSDLIPMTLVCKHLAHVSWSLSTLILPNENNSINKYQVCIQPSAARHWNIEMSSWGNEINK